jgi:pyruvate,water dikinase
MPSPGNSTSDAIGGKAKKLRELEAAGFRVPEFLCSPKDIDEAVRCLGLPLAVRSSASAEDGAAVSFAGQFKSFLNLRSASEVKDAVRRCEESIRTPGVADYCRRHGMDPGSLQMGVILQRMIEPELAGVVFTINPLTGAEEVVIEACEGLADDLLSGRKAALSPNHHLLRRYSPEIAAAARQIQQHFGAPQDIEFAIENGVLFILQARPVTQICFAQETGVWTNADFRDGGVSSSVCTPLMWSLYDFIWEDTLKGFLREIKLLDDDFQAGRMFFGRPYWNLGAVKRCLAKLPGFNERKFDEDLSVRPEYDGDGQCTPITVAGVLRALPTGFAVQSIWKQQERFARRFLNGGFEDLTKEFQDLDDPSQTAFQRLVEHAYWITESNYFRTIYCTSLAKLDFSDSFPDADYASLVSGLPGLQHFAPTQALRELRSKGEPDFTTFLNRFRHHSRRELDIRAPRWDEDPDWVRTLFSQCSGETSFDPRASAQSARQDMLSRLPWRRRRSFVRKLERLRTFLWLREEMRDLSSRMYYLIRRRVLAIARRRGLGDDIFFMTFREILENDRSNVARQRQIYESYRNFQAPNEIGNRWTSELGQATDALRGIAASRGNVQGMARVARSVEEAAQVEPGSILVCPFTDPGWTPVLSRVRGVITETGGLLSHAAIICREYGIPALLGVPGATVRIPDRSQLHLRADQGCAEVLPRKSSANNPRSQ